MMLLHQRGTMQLFVSPLSPCIHMPFLELCFMTYFLSNICLCSRTISLVPSPAHKKSSRPDYWPEMCTQGTMVDYGTEIYGLMTVDDRIDDDELKLSH